MTSHDLDLMCLDNEIFMHLLAISPTFTIYTIHNNKKSSYVYSQTYREATWASVCSQMTQFGLCVLETTTPTNGTMDAGEVMESKVRYDDLCKEDVGVGASGNQQEEN